MKKELYKIDVLKLIILVATLTTIIVLGLVFSLGFFLNHNSTIKRLANKIGERLTKGVIVNKEEQTTPEKAILKAVNANRSRVVKIYAKLNKDADLNEKNEKFLARGIVVLNNGTIATAKGGFRDDQEYSIIIPGEKNVFNIRPSIVGKQLVFFKVPLKFNLVVSLDSFKPKKRDLVVAIGGREKDGMAVGEILKVENVLNTTLITTTIPPKSIEAGTPLINQKGEVIGIYSTADDKGRSLFIAAKDVKKASLKLAE